MTYSFSDYKAAKPLPENWNHAQAKHAGWGEGERAALRLSDQLTAATYTADGKAAAPAYLVASIDPADTLYGKRLFSGFVSSTIGLSDDERPLADTDVWSVAILDALAMTTGREMIGGAKPARKLRVMVFSGSMSRADVTESFNYAMSDAGIKPEEVGKRFFVGSGLDTPLKFAGDNRVRGLMIAAFAENLKSLKIDVLIMDDKSVTADDVAAFEMIAGRAGCAILLMHLDQGGGGALAYATLYPWGFGIINKQEAAASGIPEDERSRHLRFEPI